MTATTKEACPEAATSNRMVSEPEVKRRRVESPLPNLLSSSQPSSPEPNPEESRFFLSAWPDDILIHLLDFLDLSSLQNFQLSCKRTSFHIKRNLRHLTSN